MPRAIIVHCWDGYPEYCWYPDTKEKLEDGGWQIDVPAFPETQRPQLAKWLPKLKETVGQPDEQLFLVGHSVGCITIMRYLESLPAEQKIGGVVLVAGFTEDLGYEELKNFFQTPIDFRYIKTHGQRFVAIHSDNDQYVDIKYAQAFREKLEAEIIIKHSAGHFSGSIENEHACLELPEVVSSLKTMVKV